MRHRELVGRLRKAAKRQGVEFRLGRQGGEHEVWFFGNVQFSIPRHREVDERLARALLKHVGA